MTPSSLPWRASSALRIVLPSRVVAISCLRQLFGGMVAAEALFQFRDDRIDTAAGIDFAFAPGTQDFQPFSIAEAAIPQHIVRRPVDAGRMLLDVFKQFLLGHASSPVSLKSCQAAPARARSPAPVPAYRRGNNPNLGCRAMTAR